MNSEANIIRKKADSPRTYRKQYFINSEDFFGHKPLDEHEIVRKFWGQLTQWLCCECCREMKSDSVHAEPDEPHAIDEKMDTNEDGTGRVHKVSYHHLYEELLLKYNTYFSNISAQKMKKK
jgi:hypothetical protein